jgi:hypothetical protein
MVSVFFPGPGTPGSSLVAAPWSGHLALLAQSSMRARNLAAWLAAVAQVNPRDGKQPQDNDLPPVTQNLVHKSALQAYPPGINAR